LFVIAVVAALRYLPWWALVGGVVLIVAFFKFFGGKLLLWLVSLPFRAKGRVLRGATAELLSLRPVAAPLTKLPAESNPDPETRELAPPIPPTPRDYYELDVLITPRAPTGTFRFWEAGELILVPPGKTMDDEDETCEVVKLEVLREEGGPPDEGEGLKYFGPQKLRFYIGVLPGTSRLVFQYYFEQFGEVKLDGAK
jgi:hypothetical protein